MLNRILTKINTKKTFKRCVKNYSYLLKESNYLVGDSFTHILIEHSPNSSTYFNNSKLSRNIIRLGSKKGRFTEMLICNMGDNIKLFDYSNMTVLTIFKHEHKENNRCYGFPTAKIIKDGLFEKEEELLINSNTNKFENILDFYICYYKDVTFTKKQIKSGLVLPFCIQHGDCWSGNVFNTKSGIKFIDFDCVGERFFLYDIMLYVFTEAFVNKNKILLHDFLNGVYDKQLRKIVENICPNLMSFSNNELFMIAIEEMINERFVEKNEKHMPKQIRKFLKNEGLYK